MPPLKTPVAFHEQIRSLERARTGTFLKHKLYTRPERTELVRMHILQETQADSSLQATQLMLKRARLADSLNEKISQRPGPMELVEKNILPVESEAKDDDNGDGLSSTKTPDVYSFDEDSSDCLSPGSQESHSSSSSSPRESGDKDSTPSPSLNSHKQKSSPHLQSAIDSAPSSEKQTSSAVTAVAPSVTPGPVLVKQSLCRTTGEKGRSKKSKEPKPRVKKLKYHQYIPPDQKQEHDVPMDSAYARLLQQQQQFLQLQILSQQQQYNYQSGTPAALKLTTEVQSSCSSGNSASVNPLPTLTNHRADHLPANVEEMKVAELKMELKLRSLPVSGTKTDLIERLKSYHDNSVRVEVLCDSVKHSPPVSLIATKVSSLGIKDSIPADSQDGPTEVSEKDKRLHEKERQIEELMRKLEQEQRLVEELKMQLEVEKRSQQGDSPPPLACPALLQVKEEIVTPSNCSESSTSPVLLAGVKQEVKVPTITHPVQLPASTLTLNLHSGVSSPGLVQTSGHAPKTMSTVLQQQCTTQKAWTGAAPNVLNTFPGSGCVTEDSSSQTTCKAATDTAPCPNEDSLILQQPKSKDPPRYEEAVKQTRGMLTQFPSVSSQQMDDLFDVLIESGEILPFIKHEPQGLDKPLPVTASVTTLPINTVLCRPPAVVQVAQLPVPSTQTHPLKQLEELHSPLTNMEMDFAESTPGSDSNLHNEDGMDWLDVADTLTHVSIFSSDFLDSHDMHLNWE